MKFERITIDAARQLQRRRELIGGIGGRRSVEVNSPVMNSRITFNPKQCGGRPCIRGLRIRVKDVIDMLASGASDQEILQAYPYLEPEDIKASLQYAAAQVDHAVVSGA